MKIQSINLNLFKAGKVEKTEQKNPFIGMSISNPFAGKLSSDIFQSSSIENKQPNYFAQKAAELVTSWNKGVESFKGGAKEFFAPAISFAGKIKSGYEKLNSINLEDMFSTLKDEISMLSLDKDVRRYAKMPIAELREELAKELIA